MAPGREYLIGGFRVPSGSMFQQGSQIDINRQLCVRTDVLGRRPCIYFGCDSDRCDNSPVPDSPRKKTRGVVVRFPEYEPPHPFH